MKVYLNIKEEIQPLTFYQGDGFEIVKGKDKTIINKGTEKFYLNLTTLEIALNTSGGRLEELISYNAGIKGYLAYYRNEDFRAIKLISVHGLDELFRHIRGLEFNNRLLKDVKEKVTDLIKIIEEKESR